VDEENLVSADLRLFYKETFTREKSVYIDQRVYKEISSGVTTLNLQQCYPNAVLCNEEIFYETVPNEVADVMFANELKRERLIRLEKRYLLPIELDEKVETEASQVMAANPENIINSFEQRCNLCNVMSCLTTNQKRRIVNHFIYGLSRNEIATAEDVDVSSTNESISRGLMRMKNNYSKISQKKPCQSATYCLTGYKRFFSSVPCLEINGLEEVENNV